MARAGFDITLDAGGKVRITGWVLGGPGSAGANAVVDGSGTDGTGGLGGTVHVFGESEVNVTGGARLMPGQGGPGGAAMARDATGGRGGNAGILNILSNATVAVDGYLLGGWGGSGGDALGLNSQEAGALGGEGGNGTAPTLTRGSKAVSLTAGHWKLAWTGSGLSVTNFTLTHVLPEGKLTAPIPEMGLQGHNIALPLAASSRAALTPTGGLDPASCSFLLNPSPLTRPDYATAGGRGGAACTEGTDGPAGSDGDPGEDSTGPLTTCTDGELGGSPSAPGGAGGLPRGGAGGSVDVGIGGSGGDALSVGGPGGSGGRGGDGGDGWGTQAGCDGGNGGDGGDGGLGGNATGGHGGFATCGYGGNAGGARSNGGAPGLGGDPGVDGEDGGLSGAVGGVQQSRGINGTRGMFGAVASGLIGNWTTAGACNAFNWTALQDGILLAQGNLTTSNFLTMQVGHLHATTTISGEAKRHTLVWDDVLGIKDSLSGSEVSALFPEDFLTSRSFYNLTGDPGFNETWDNTTDFLALSGAERMDDFARFEFAASADEVQHPISDFFTYRLECVAPTPALSPEEIPAADESCDEGQAEDYIQTLPVTHQWYDNFNSGALPSFIDGEYTADGWDAGCGNQIRYVKVKFDLDEKAPWSHFPQTSQYYEDLGGGSPSFVVPCDKQYHVRIFSYPAWRKAFAQAHWEHRHYPWAKHSVHSTDNSGLSIGEDAQAWASEPFDNNVDWSYHARHTLVNAVLNADWEVRNHSSRGTDDGYLDMIIWNGP